MLNRIVKLLENTNNVKRSSYFWNAASAGTLAMQSPIILMVISRCTDLMDAGVFSIAVAVSNLMMYMGQYGLRRFQSSDIKAKYSFGEYHGMRIITCMAMLIASLVYCIYGAAFLKYSREKFAVVFLVCVLRFIQAYTDVFHGQMQQRGRLDVATKSSTIRYCFEMLFYCVGLIATHDLFIATCMAVAVSFAIMMLTTINAARFYCDSMKPAFRKRKLKMLAIEGFPLFVSMFLNMYVGNAAKYGIDLYLSDDIQAVFNMIFMPAYVIQLVAHFIFNPILTTYAELWLSDKPDDYNKLKKLVQRQCIIIVAMLGLALLVSVTVALPILSWWFGVDLNDYVVELCIIMFGGAMLAYATYFSTVIAVIREQRALMICYAVVAVGAKALQSPLVAGYGMIGASLLYAIVMVVLAGLLSVVVVRSFRRHKIS